MSVETTDGGDHITYSCYDVMNIVRIMTVETTDYEMSKGFDVKAFEGILVEYDDVLISYHVYIPGTNILAISTQITIDE